MSRLLEGAALILALDKQQSIQNPNAKFCTKPEHGRLLVLKNQHLGCTICGYVEPAVLDTEAIEAPRVRATLEEGAPAVRVR